MGEAEDYGTLNQRTTIGVFPWKCKDGEAAFCRVVAFHEA